MAVAILGRSAVSRPWVSATVLRRPAMTDVDVIGTGCSLWGGARNGEPIRIRYQTCFCTGRLLIARGGARQLARWCCSVRGAAPHGANHGCGVGGSAGRSSAQGSPRWRRRPPWRSGRGRAIGWSDRVCTASSPYELERLARLPSVHRPARSQLPDGVQAPSVPLTAVHHRCETGPDPRT